MPVTVELSHKGLRFLLYKNRELKLFYAIKVHSEFMSHALLLFKDRMFSCQTTFSHFLVKTWYGVHLLASCWWTGHYCTAHSQCLPALLSLQFSRSVTSTSSQPHGPQYPRPPCPSPTPGVYSNSCLLSW